MPDPFVHLHVHTEYSLLDGKSGVDEIAAAAAEFGMPAVAITDHGNPGGIFQFAQRCREYGVKPIPGLEAYHDVGLVSESEKRNHHLILLATSDTGYRNMLRLSSRANLHNFHYKGRVTDEMLAQHSEGLVVTTACLGSEVNQALVRGDYRGAVEATAKLRDIFGSERTFVELQDHGIKDQHRIMGEQLRLARELDLKLVATNDSHYTTASEAEVHDALLCVQTGRKLSDPERFRFEAMQNWFRSPAEMRELFPERDFPGACANTLLVAEMTDVDPLAHDGFLIPEFPLPDDERDANALLRKITYKGLRERLGNSAGELPPDVERRAEYELGVIERKEVPSYFLIVGDITRWARSQGIWLGPGRGSAAGSLVSYGNYITDVNPLQFGLYFERFMNPDRPTMPDIDIDFEPDGRELVVQYAARKYGLERIARYGTYGTMKARGALRDAAKVLGEEWAVGDLLSKTYPADIMQRNAPIGEVLAETPAQLSDERWLPWWESENGYAFRKLYRGQESIRRVVDLAMGLEGTIRQEGTHAAGLLIAPGRADEIAPLRKDKEGGDIPVTQFTMTDMEALGALKIDLLIITNLPALRLATQLVRETHGVELDLLKLPLDDPRVYRMLSAGETEGVFQLAERGATDMLIRIKPTSFADISAAIALYRPGPMGSKVHHRYADRKNGRERIDVPHPDMLDILEETYGLTVYQEQIMELATHFAGYSTSDADKFRKAMGKKDISVMEAQREQFLRGCVDTGFGAKLGDQLWEIIEPFSGYAFNKAHSVSYGLISYWTAYMKANYPAEYTAALIDTTDNKDRKAIQVESARRAGITVQPPDINRSNVGPRTTAGSGTGTIYLGLSGIGGCGPGPVSRIIVERQANGPFRDFRDFLLRTRGSGINKTAVAGLVHAGAFDGLHATRRPLAEQTEELIAAAKREVELDTGGDDLFDLGDDVQTSLEMYSLEGPDYGLQERTALQLKALGFHVGEHPFVQAEERLRIARANGAIPERAVPADSGELDPEAGRVTVLGVLTELTVSQSRKGEPYSRFVLEAGHGRQLAAIQFRTAVERELLHRIVCCTGQLRQDSAPGSEEVQLALTVEELTPVDLESGERRGLRMVRGGAGRRPQAARREPEPEPEPAPRSEPEPEPEPETLSGVTFRVEDQAVLRVLSHWLRGCGSGSVPVVIVLNEHPEEPVSHPELTFNLDRDRLAEFTSIAGSGVAVECS